MASSGGDKFPDDPEAKDGLKSDLADFEARLRKTQKAHQEPLNNAGRGTAMGIAFRLTTELVAGIIVGGGIGLLLDKWLGTGPLFLLVFFFLGMAAGILNVLKTAKQMTAQAELDAKSDNQGS
ncbi:MAG: AtpZ/AtpI family protein [Parvibaculum sp.]|nr:AtpZ/AtpI family protein [Parvibaculum sp.]